MKPGVYLGLDEIDYFAAPALGSSDLKTLASCAHDWWAGSKLNPDMWEAPAKADAKDSLALGKAVHKYALEGKKAFEEAFAVEPPYSAPRANDIESMRRALAAKDIQTPVHISPSELKKLCRDHGVRLKDDLLATFNYEVAAGKIPLAYDSYRKAKIISDAMQADPSLSQLATNGLSEVSIFWERDGVLLRARIDRLLPLFSLDAKTITPSYRAKSFRDACLTHVADYRYDIQSELYREARTVAPNLKIYGGTKAERTLLKAILKVPEDPDGIVGWTSAWLFIQPPHAERGKGRALKILPIIPSSYPDAWEVRAAQARADIEMGLFRFRAGVNKFGDTKAWQEISQPWTPSADDWGWRLKVKNND
jgi:hypothetical protein